MERLEQPRLRVGLWGWSQGAWAAALAASQSSRVDGLVLLAATGVSPAEQMRYGTAEHLRREGYGRQAIRDLTRLRDAYERYLRKTLDRRTAQRLVDQLSSCPWFRLAWVPRHLSAGRWPDMDFDPGPVFARVRVPVLLFYGETDEWSPIEKSVRVWHRAARRLGNRAITIVRLPGTSHAPTIGGRHSSRAISPLYHRTLDAWLGSWLVRPRGPPAP